MMRMLFLTPVMCAGPETAPQRRSDVETWLMVMLAKGAVAVVGTERSRTQFDSLDSEHGVWELSEDEGRMMCVCVWLVMEIEVAVVERDGRSVAEPFLRSAAACVCLLILAASMVSSSPSVTLSF
jgi:hypothetical protein